MSVTEFVTNRSDHTTWKNPEGQAECANCGRPVTEHDFGYLFPRCPVTPARITILSTPPTNLRAVRDRLSRLLAGAMVTKGVSIDELEGVVNELDRILEYEETR